VSEDLHTLTGAYAADAVDEDERRGFDEHLRVCAACRDEVAELRATTARLAAAAYTEPPPHLRERVLEAAARTRQHSPLPVIGQRRAGRARPLLQQPVAAAAALMLVVAAGLAGLAVSEKRRADRAEARAERIATVLTHEQRVERTVDLRAGGSATMVAAGDAAVLRTRGLPRLDDERVYQLWLVRRGSAQSVGVLGAGGALTALVQDMTSGDVLGLTIEPSGGSDEPTGDMVLEMEMSPAA
jgi:anti-sigma-K factor RskA